MTTIEDIYAGINPLPAMLTAKGKVKPEAVVMINANARLSIMLKWKKALLPQRMGAGIRALRRRQFRGGASEGRGVHPGAAIGRTGKAHHFMGKLGNLIDAGKDEGIEVDYLNPLLDTMKRLSENVITYQPAA
jgi:hypothetical protein